MKFSSKLRLFLIFAGLFLVCLFFWLVLKAILAKPVPDLTLPKPTALPSEPQVSLVVAGDVMLARSVTQKMRTLGDFGYPFAQVSSFLKKADLTLVNLEAPFGTDCSATDGGMVFCADYQAIQGLIEAGVDLVSIANNHALDQGEEGLTETINLLEDSYLVPLGLKEPVFLTKNGLNLVFLAYNAVNPRNDFVSWAEPSVVVEEIKKFSQNADVLVVYFHWGKEYEEKPMAGSGCPFDPVKLAHLAVEAGADLVLGAHPHVIQENEWYQGKLIVYSLGNFVFDQTWSQETQRGQVGRFVLGKKGLVTADFFEVEIVDYQPRIRVSP